MSLAVNTCCPNPHFARQTDWWPGQDGRSSQRQPRVEREGRSAETKNAFFRREKITAHFARRDPSMDAKVVSKSVVGDIRRYCTLARKTTPRGVRLASFYTRSGRDRMAMTGHLTPAATPAATTVMTKARPRNMWQSCLPGQRLLAR
jgi:hypothetical protein